MSNSGNRRLFGVIALVALLAGFGLARLADEPLHASSRGSEGAHAHDGHQHDDHKPDHDDETAHAHGHGSHDHTGDHEHGGEHRHGDGHRDGHDHMDQSHDAHDHADHDHDHHEHEEGVVSLTTRQVRDSGITVVPVGRGGGQEVRLTGRVELAIDARAAVSAIVGGRVERVAVAPGVPVETGQTLAVLLSGEGATLRAQADAAAAEAETARLAYRRDENLVAQGVVARQELESSRARSLAADAAARAAQAQVTAAGAPDAEGRIAIQSPIAGTVGMVRVMPGGFVPAGAVIAEVADPARAELVFTAPPALAAQLTIGTRMQVSGPVGRFEAVVAGVAVDVHERSGGAIVRARPESGELPPAGSPVAAVLVTDRRDDVLTAPTDAVQTLDGKSVVFVATDGGFRATPVEPGRQASGRIEILGGLDGTERIAGSNAFLLKAELAKGEAEHVH